MHPPSSEAAVLLFFLEIKEPECFYLNRAQNVPVGAESQHTYRWSPRHLQKRDSNLPQSANTEAREQSPVSGLGIT